VASSFYAPRVNNWDWRAGISAADYIRGCVEGSLQRLGIEAMIYLLHNPTLENMQARIALT